MRLRQALHAFFPHIDPASLPNGFDLVGDIAILSLPRIVQPQAQLIGEHILALHNRVKVVALRQGEHSGAYRLAPLRVIAGEHRLETVHTESGLKLLLDIGQVYFSVRLAGERLRLASLVQADEQLCVLGSGIGVLPLVIVAHSAVGAVTGIEMNPRAQAYAVHNCQINRRQPRIDCRFGRGQDVLPRLARRFDRMIIMLPWDPLSLLPVALLRLKEEGFLHVYAMHEKGAVEQAGDKLASACQRHGRVMKSWRVQPCGHCRSSYDRVCVDALIA